MIDPQCASPAEPARAWHLFLDQQALLLHLGNGAFGDSFEVTRRPLAGRRRVGNRGRRIIQERACVLGTGQARAVGIRLTVDHLAAIN